MSRDNKKNNNDKGDGQREPRPATEVPQPDRGEALNERYRKSEDDVTGGGGARNSEKKK